MTLRAIFFYAISYISSRRYLFRGKLANRLNAATDFCYTKFVNFMSPQLEVAEKEKKKWQVFLISISASVVLLFGANLIFCTLRGTLQADKDPLTRFFFEDTADIINYLFVCPAYVTLSTFFFLYANRLETSQNDLWNKIKYDLPPRNRILTLINAIVLGGILMGLAFVITTGYAKDFRLFEIRFWPLDIDVNRGRIYSFHGYYYLVTTFVLSMFMLVAGVYHFAMYRVAYRFEYAVRSILKQGGAQAIPKEILETGSVRDLFKPLSTVSALSKLVVAAFMLNAFTWSWQGVEQRWVFTVSVLALFVLGVGVFSFPRYHIQYWLYQLWRTVGQEEYIDIRTPISKGIGAAANAIVLSTTAYTLLLDTVLKLAGAGNLSQLLEESIKALRQTIIGI